MKSALQVGVEVDTGKLTVFPLFFVIQILHRTQSQLKVFIVNVLLFIIFDVSFDLC